MHEPHALEGEMTLFSRHELFSDHERSLNEGQSAKDQHQHDVAVF